MPRHASGPLDRVEIVSPCSADWDSMTGNDRVRFCEHCRLHVHDVAAMTPAQAYNLVLGSPGRLCLRVHRRPDGSLVTRALPEPLYQLRRRVSRVAAGAFGAALGLCAAVAAHAQTTAAAPAAVAGQRAPAPSGGGGNTLTGTVVDPAGAVVPGAAVSLVNEQTGLGQQAVTDDDGVYRFASLEAGTYTLLTESPGFARAEVKGVAVLNGSGPRADVTLHVAAEHVTVGVVGVVEPTEPLVRAAFDDDLEAVRRLLAGGADANFLDKDTGTSALSQAVANGNREIVVELLRAGAEVNARLEYRQTALMKLSSKTSEELVRELLFAGAKVNARDEDGNTALMVAAGWGAPEVVELLLRAGARVNARNKGLWTPLMYAAGAGSKENIPALISAGADLDRRHDGGATALMMARENGHAETADLLLSLGATDDPPQEPPGETAARP